jgi:hypothetical protein
MSLLLCDMWQCNYPLMALSDCVAVVPSKAMTSDPVTCDVTRATLTRSCGAKALEEPQFALYRQQKACLYIDSHNKRILGSFARCRSTRHNDARQ